MAKEQHKNAEFLFKREPHPEVRQSIESGKVIVWNKE